MEVTQTLFLGLKNNELLHYVHKLEFVHAVHPFISPSDKQLFKHPEKSLFKNGAVSLHLVQ